MQTESNETSFGGIQHDERILLIRSYATDTEIRDTIVHSGRICIETKKPAWLWVDGFNNDPRELWDIPQAVDLLKRVYRFGAMSIIVIAETDPTKQLGMTAIGLWAAVNDHMNKTWDAKAADRFEKDLQESNRRFEALLREYGSF